MRSLDNMTLDGLPTHVDVDVLVIDNACSAATAELCQLIGSDLKLPLRYFAEPQRGISQARNRAVAEALLGGADLIAFIDDDDQPRTNWLQASLGNHLNSKADIVFGCWVFGAEVPDWARNSSLFKSMLNPGDSQKAGDYGLPWMASTCNVLIGRAILEKISREGPVFREQFSRSGGEDKDFFIRALQAGAKLESEEESIIIRYHEPSRFTASGLLQRGFKNGCSRMSKIRQHGTGFELVKRYVATLCKALLKMIGVLLTLVFCLFSRRLLMHQLYRLGKAAGVIYSAFTGRSYGYYNS